MEMRFRDLSCGGGGVATWPAREAQARALAGPYRELFERSADAILIIEDDMFVDCNEAAVRMLRYTSKEEVLRTHPSELSSPTQPDGRDSYEKANEMIALAFEKGNDRFEWAHRRADGEVFPVEVLLTAVREGERQTLHVVWRDITERRHLEKQLRHARKMEALGKLAEGIAHDFNDLLVVILGHADMLRDCTTEQPEAMDHVDQIAEAGPRAAALVKQLLAFGRKRQLLPEVLEINGLVVGLRLLLERLIGEELVLETAAVDEKLFVKADRGQLGQVLMNLVSNARDGIVRKSGGAARLESNPGEGGTTVRVYLPLREQVLSRPQGPFRARPVVRPGGCETVLVVEDEEAVAHLVVPGALRPGVRGGVRRGRRGGL